MTKWFLFDDTDYRQTDSVTIGSSLGATQSNFDPNIIVDTLIIIMSEHKNLVKKFLRYMNHVIVTFNLLVRKKISFMGISITR